MTLGEGERSPSGRVVVHSGACHMVVQEKEGERSPSGRVVVHSGACRMVVQEKEGERRALSFW